MSLESQKAKKAKLQGISIAIDGPVAAGKGTIAPALAKRLKGFYLYTGAMYRCVALFCIETGIDLKDEEKVDSILEKLRIDFKGSEVFLNGKNVTEDIKNEDVAMGASKVAIYEKVRTKLVSYQKRIAKEALLKGISVVAEGRDTATKVLPNANLKIFLTAKPKIRAERRFNQVKERGEKETFRQVLEDVIKRDKQDREREIDPLVTSPVEVGYEVLDNSYLSEEETVLAIISKLK